VADTYRDLIDKYCHINNVSYGKIEAMADMASGTIGKVVNGDQKLSPRTAWLLGKYTTLSPRELLRLQAEFYYDRFLADLEADPDAGRRIWKSKE